jgi:putative colanic acid biosynthesis acetyltransferase WcaF
MKSDRPSTPISARHEVPADENKRLPDIDANRAARKWSAKELAGRLMWELVRFPLFALSPRQFWAWRRMLLRVFGATIGQQVHIYPSVKIAVPWNVAIGDYAAIGEGAILYSLGEISVGERATISQYAHLCAGTHDYRDPSMPLVRASISVGAGAWICADAFIGPGVTVGNRAIVGARAVAMRNVAECVVVVGNPARKVATR